MPREKQKEEKKTRGTKKVGKTMNSAKIKSANRATVKARKTNRPDFHSLEVNGFRALQSRRHHGAQAEVVDIFAALKKSFETAERPAADCPTRRR